MKRRALQVCLFLLAGAIINVAVAWALAAWELPAWALAAWELPAWARQPRYDTVLINASDGSVWLGHLGSTTGARFLTWDERVEPGDGLSPEWESIAQPHWSAADADHERRDESTERAYGWPMICLSYEVRLIGWANPGGPGYGCWPQERAIILPPRNPANPYLFSSIRALPRHVIWRGFVVNTVAFALALGLLASGVASVRRHSRTRRRLCISCAYPIGTNSVCTECGVPVKPLIAG